MVRAKVKLVRPVALFATYFRHWSIVLMVEDVRVANFDYVGTLYGANSHARRQISRYLSGPEWYVVGKQ